MVAMMNELLVRGMTLAAGLKARLAEERGQDLMEYAVLTGFIAIAAAVALTAAGLTGVLNGMALSIKNCIDFSATTPCP